MSSSKNAIIIGASSGIGEALAQVLAEQGYTLGLAARREDKLLALQSRLPVKSYVKKMDVARPEEAGVALESLLGEMKRVDLIVINAGVNIPNPDLGWDAEYQTIATNVLGFVAMAVVALKHFMAQGRGHLVGVSSIASLRGSAVSPAYNASKAFMANYLSGLRYRFLQSNITITDIRPGFVDTPMVRDKQGKFWVASCRKAAEHILAAIQKKKKVMYVPHRWGLVAWCSRLIPEWLYIRLYNWKCGG